MFIGTPSENLNPVVIQSHRKVHFLISFLRTIIPLNEENIVV